MHKFYEDTAFCILRRHVNIVHLIQGGSNITFLRKMLNNLKTSNYILFNKFAQNFWELTMLNLSIFKRLTREID